MNWKEENMAKESDDTKKIEDTIYKRAPIAKKIKENKVATLTLRNRSYKFEDTIIIGRDKSCNIVINDPLVSRRHAKITLVDGQKFYIEDLNSTNGTYINNNPVMKGTKKLLKQDDEIRIGNTVLIFNFF